MPSSRKPPADPASLATLTTSARSTISGPSAPPAAGALTSDDPAVVKFAAAAELADKMRENRNKAAEYGDPAEEGAPEGVTAKPGSPIATASTLSESNTSDKLGDEIPDGENLNTHPLSDLRADSSGRMLTTNQGVPVADNQHSLKAGLRGPALLEDFILREKITHFDHERIPERIVHARGSGAHGYFECYEPLKDITQRIPIRRQRASARRSSCASRRSLANAAQPTRRVTCAASPSSSTRTKATGTWSATTFPCSSSRMR